MTKILIVDDQRNMRTTLSLMLRGAGYEVAEAASAEQAAERLREERFDLVLTDLKMSGADGIHVVKSAKRYSPLTEVIVMTAYGTIESAVRAVKSGALDYLEKPFSEEQLLTKIEAAVEKVKKESEPPAEEELAELRERHKLDGIVGRSKAIREVLGRIVRVAPTDTTVLVTGESGTGKEVVARALHANSSRADRPFVPVNCAAISETLLESELFGHARGAYTGAVSARKGLFEEANGGTFFFDEIAETPPSFQAKLLRAIQEGEIRRLGENQPITVDVRVIAATNQDLRKAIQEKRFRKDLYYRLNVARFQLPPLRERGEDIPLLYTHFLRKHNERMGRSARLGEGVAAFLEAYSYPGNIRELENLIEQGVALAGDDGEIRLEDIIPEDVRPEAEEPVARTLQEAVDRAERKAILDTLERVDGNKEKAAESLGLSATTLWRKMKRLNVQWDQGRRSSKV